MCSAFSTFFNKTGGADMRHLVFVVVTYITVFLTQEGSAYCYGEEGSSEKIDCYSPIYTTKGLDWTVETEDGSIDVVSCSYPNSCSSMYPDHFNASMISADSYLTIRNLSRTVPFNMDRTRWTCRWRENCYTQTVCSSFKVYAYPEKPTCEPPVRNSSTYEIQMACTTVKAYPEPYCLLKMGKDNDTLEWKTPLISYEHVRLDGNVTYYRSTCTVYVPFGDIVRYGHYLQIAMGVTRRSYTEGDVIRVNPALLEEKDVSCSETTTHLDVETTVHEKELDMNGTFSNLTTLIKEKDISSSEIATHPDAQIAMHEKELDKNRPFIISLAVLLASTICVSILLAAVVCKYRKQASERVAAGERPKITTEI